MTARKLFWLACYLSCVAYSPIGAEEYVTQTVYGFLEFTTTIGNTVMIFSPHSAEVKNPESTPKPSITTVIETKPSTTKTPIVIKPSHTQQVTISKEKSSKSPVVKSVVQVQSSSPKKASSKVEIKSTKVTPSPPNSKVPNNNIKSKVEVVGVSQSQALPLKSAKPKNVIIKVETVVSATKTQTQQPKSKASSIVQVKSNDDVIPEIAIIGNNLAEPEYDFLSRQPSEFVEETYKVVNLIPNSKFQLKPRSTAEGHKHKATKRADGSHPTGLVTKLGGSVVRDGTTTLLETSVIGTYISGKYAQVLQSTSKVLQGNNKGKIHPSPSLRILKTAAPTFDKKNKQHRQNVEATPVDSISEESVIHETPQNSIKSTRKPGSSFKPRFKNRRRENEDTVDNVERVTQASKKVTKTFGRSSKEETSSTKRYSRRNQKSSRTEAPQSATVASTKRSGFKPRPHSTESSLVTPPSGSAKFKLNRSPGRWQYKTTPKPRVTIRKQLEDEQNKIVETTSTTVSNVEDEEENQQLNKQTSSNEVILSPQSRSDDEVSLEGSESIASVVENESTNKNKIDNVPGFPVETLKVEISTPPEFKDIYYEIATIKTPYTFQAGNVKNTRYITVTSTFERSLTPEPSSAISPSEPLTENILATTSNFAKDNNLDSSIATLPPIYLNSDMETPPLETLTETFSTTTTMYKTHILPLVRNGNETSTSTLTQTYLITRLVTATKTLPPVEAYHFNPSKTLKEFNTRLDEAGSEMHLELEFGDQNDQENEEGIKKVIVQDLDLIGSEFNLNDFDKSKLEGHLAKHGNMSFLNQQQVMQPQQIPQQIQQQQQVPQQDLQQLALLNLLKSQQSQQPQLPGQVITTSRPVVKIETLYETHVLPVTQGSNTILSTISKVKGTYLKTDFEFGTSTVPPQLGLPQIPPPIFPPQQPQFAVTSSPVVQTTLVTQTDSKVLKLTFGAKTAKTTVYSTKVIPTVTTTYVTASVPVPAVPPVGGYPGYFPAPGYPGYPYVG